MDPTFPEILGVALGLAILALALATALEILVAILVSYWMDLPGAFTKLKTWWRERRPAKGWQPGEHPRGPRPWKGIRWPR